MTGAALSQEVISSVLLPPLGHSLNMLDASFPTRHTQITTKVNVMRLEDAQIPHPSQAGSSQGTWNKVGVSVHPQGWDVMLLDVAANALCCCTTTGTSKTIVPLVLLMKPSHWLIRTGTRPGSAVPFYLDDRQR